MELLFALVTVLCSFFSPQEVVNEIDVPIIMYHNIEDDKNKLNEFSVTPEKFENDMLKIKEMGYEAVSYKELYDFVNNGTNLPSRPLLITFDDGYESNYKYAYPVLKKLNMKATIAIIGVMVGRDTYNGMPAYRHFNYKQASEMYDSGLIDIQTHTFDLHNIENRVGIKRKDNEDANKYIDTVKSDITKSIEEIYKELGNEQFVFTYPYGAYDYLTEKILQELNFKITVTTVPGVNHIVRYDNNSLLKLKRFDIKEELNIESLLNGIDQPVEVNSK